MNEIYSNLPEIFNASEYFIKNCNLEKGRGSKSALLYKDNIYTYGDVEKYSSQYGNMLLDLGIQIEQRIAILLPDQPEYVFAFWGAIRAGIVPVLINERLKIKDIRFIIENCRAKLLLTNTRWKNELEEINSPWLKHVLLVDKDVPSEESVHSIINKYSIELQTAKTSRDDIAFWMYTSGSSGVPKGVMHLHHDMVICTELYGKGILNMTEKDLIYSVAKLPFAYGLGNTLFLTFGVGATSILDGSTNAFEILDVINSRKPTLFFATPSVYSAILHVKDLISIDISTIRTMVSGGEILPKTLWHKWKENFGNEILEGLGTTELLHIFISNRIGQIKPGSTGLEVPGYSVSIVDENNKPVPPGVVGDLMVGGESLMLGYWNRHLETQKVMFGNYMKTGDKYYRDEDGYFYYVGRSIDLFKVNGLWVEAHEVENILLRNPKVKQAAVNGQFNEESLTKVVAYVTLQPEIEPSQELTRELTRFMKANLDHYKCPTVYNYVNEIPLGATGKIDRIKLKEIEILNTK